MLLEGIFVPLTTPFHADGRLFVRKLEYNVERYSRTPVSGMFVLGENSEADGLTGNETRAVLTVAIGAAAPEKVMVASVGCESVFATLELAEFAATLDYDAMAVRVPRLVRGPQFASELRTYFLTLADHSPLPIVIENTEEHPFADDLLIELASHPRFVGTVTNRSDEVLLGKLREASTRLNREAIVTTVFAAATGRMLQAARATVTSSLGGVALLDASPTLKTRTKKIGLQVLASSTSAMLSCWQAGGTGAVPRLAASAPQACCEVWQAFKDGDPALAEEKQDRLREIAELLQGPRGIAAVKHGCDFNGYFGGRPRLPLLPPSADECDWVERKLAGMRN
jgi:dihydrodipicolinate synthase/N-acetylneuraminate lyase